jgi:RNA polymerase sigma-70 factor (ECF subfamily)
VPAIGEAIAVNGMSTASVGVDVCVAPEICKHALGVLDRSKDTPDDTENVIELYALLQSPLRAYLGTFGLCADEVEDVIQEAFLRLMRHLREYQAGAKAEQLWDQNHRGWLFRVAHNCVMDGYRSSRKAPCLSHEDVYFLLSHHADPALDPEQTLLRKEKLARLNSAMSKLTIEQRGCLLLRAKGWRHKEIAFELGISAHQAKKLLQQGLDTLTDQLKTGDRANHPRIHPEPVAASENLS